MKRTGIIAKKIGMSSLFRSNGKRVTLTLLHIEDCQVVAQRTMSRDGYNAVIVGVKNAKPHRVAKPQKGEFAKAKIEPKVKIKEFRVSEQNLVEVGVEIKASHFSLDQYVDVQAKSIGKGFAGSMKRHNFRGMEASHGVSISHRAHGSTGQCQDPGKVFKNKKMAGHLGDETVTMQNLRVVKIDDENGLLYVSGNVPGPKGAFVYVKDAIKKSLVVNR